MHRSPQVPTGDGSSAAGTLMLGLSAAWGPPRTAAAAPADAAAAGGSPAGLYEGAPPPPPRPPPTTAVSWFDLTPLSRQTSTVTGMSSAGGMPGAAVGELGPSVGAVSAYELGVAIHPPHSPSPSGVVAARAPCTPPWRPAGAPMPPLMPSPLSPATPFTAAAAPAYLPSPLVGLWVGPPASAGADGGMTDRSAGVGDGGKAAAAPQTLTSLAVPLTTGTAGPMSDGDVADRGSLVSVAAAAVGWLHVTPAAGAAASATVDAGDGLPAMGAPAAGGGASTVAAALGDRGWGGAPEPTTAGEDSMSMMQHLNSSYPLRDDMIERTLQELFEL